MNIIRITGIILIFTMTVIKIIWCKKQNKKRGQEKNYIQDNTKLNLFLARTFLSENQNVTGQNHSN